MNLLIMISISIFCCYENVFIHMNTWVNWGKCNDTLLPEKEDCYSHLNVEHFTDEGYF